MRHQERSSKHHSIERRAELYKESSCIEEYCVKRDLEMPAFKLKLFDVVVFWHKHSRLCKTIITCSSMPLVIFSLTTYGILFLTRMMFLHSETYIWFEFIVPIAMTLLEYIGIDRLIKAGYKLDKLH